jgi:hypothetical protein
MTLLRWNGGTMNPYKPPEETPPARKETNVEQVLEDPRIGFPVAIANCVTLAVMMVVLFEFLG